MADETATGPYRCLAVRVSNILAGRELKTIIVTSAREGEGKTTVAANLAASIAHLAKGRVLLIDGDLRRPRLGERLGILPRFGWGDLVEGLASPMNSIVRTEPGALHVLVNKSICQLPQSSASQKLVDLLASPRPEELLEELKQQFEVIIVDCPCITEYAEAQKLALIADGTIMVVRAGKTHHSAVTDALKLVPKERRLGIVLNDSEV
jgi:capsular exopolysaccharide synthesis family protein